MVPAGWHTIEAVGPVAGTDIGRAVVEPAAVAALAKFDAEVRRDGVVESV